MQSSSDGIPADVAGTLEDHVDDALAHATDGTARFHLRHAKQLLVDLDAEAHTVDEPAADEQTGEERGDAD